MDLLTAYGSDTEEEPAAPEEAAGVEAESPCCGGGGGGAPAAKRPRLLQPPPLPRSRPALPDAAALLDGGGSSNGSSGNGSAGAAAQLPARVRAFPHVEGNYATVVYVTVPAQATEQLHRLAAALTSECASGRGSGSNGGGSGRPRLWPTAAAPGAEGGGPPGAAAGTPVAASTAAPPGVAPREQDLPLHLSLSRTVAIRHIQIGSLRAALAKQLKPLRGFALRLHGLACLANESSTRSFVGVRAATGGQQVARLLAAVDRAFVLHGLPPFHKEPLPHVSLAWAPGDQRARLQPWLDAFDHAPVVMQVAQVVCQIGKVKHVVWEAP